MGSLANTVDGEIVRPPGLGRQTSVLSRTLPNLPSARTNPLSGHRLSRQPSILSKATSFRQSFPISSGPSNELARVASTKGQLSRETSSRLPLMAAVPETLNVPPKALATPHLPKRSTRKRPPPTTTAAHVQHKLHFVDDPARMRIHQKLLEAAAAHATYSSGSQSARSATDHRKEFHSRLLAAGMRAQQEKESALRSKYPMRRETTRDATVDEHSHHYAQLLRRRSRASALSPNMVVEGSSDEDARSGGSESSSSLDDDGLSFSPCVRCTLPNQYVPAGRAGACSSANLPFSRAIVSAVSLPIYARLLRHTQRACRCAAYPR